MKIVAFPRNNYKVPLKKRHVRGILYTVRFISRRLGVFCFVCFLADPLARVVSAARRVPNTPVPRFRLGNDALPRQLPYERRFDFVSYPTTG